MPALMHLKSDEERNYRNHITEHEDIIREAKELIFFGEHSSQVINVFDQTSVQKVGILHHFFHTPLIILNIHGVKIYEE